MPNTLETPSLRILITDEQVVALRLISDAMSYHSAAAAIVKAYDEGKAELEAYAGHIARARDEYESNDVEIDDCPAVSPGGDPGVWVAAWVWSPDADEDKDGTDEEEA